MSKMLSYDEDEHVIEGTATDLTGIQDNIDDELNKICSEIDDDSGDVQFRIKVYRIMKNQGERAWLFDALPSELPILPRLRDEYGGGEFETIIYKKNRIFKRRKMLVEVPKKPVVQLPTNSSDVETVLKYVTNGMTQLADAVKEIKQQPQAQPVDQMAQMRQMIEIMVMMKSFYPEQKTEKNSDSMDVFLKGIEFAKDIAISGGGDVSTGQMVLEAIKNLGKPLAEMMTRNSQQVAQIPPKNQARLAQPVMSNPAPRPSERNQEDSDVGIIANMIQSRLAKELPKLCEKAAANRDPNVYALLIVEEIDPAYHKLVGEFLVDETWYKRLENAEPKIANHKQWFEELRYCILCELGIISEEEQEESAEIDNGISEEITPVNGTEKES